MSLGKQIKALRDFRGKNQFDVSIGTGIDRSRLSLMENGYVQPTDEQLAKIKDFLGWDQEDAQALLALVCGQPLHDCHGRSL